MPDFVPDDFEAYVERSRRVDRVLGSLDDDKVEEACEQLVQWAATAAEALVATGGVEPQQAVSALSGLVAGYLADWYALTEYEVVREDEDDE